jgi:retron-type reverse transcriptase
MKRVERNGGAAGIDGMTVKELRPYLKEHWLEIREALERGSYKPAAVKRVEIPKPDGGARQLGIPTVIDRLLQQAIAQVLTPIFERKFSAHSYGFRPGRSAHDAVKTAQEYAQEGAGGTSPWRMAASPVINQALSNGYFRNLGLKSVKIRYQELCLA